MNSRHISLITYNPDGTETNIGYDLPPDSPIFKWMDDGSKWPEVFSLGTKFFILEDWNGCTDARYTEAPGFVLPPL